MDEKDSEDNIPISDFIEDSVTPDFVKVDSWVLVEFAVDGDKSGKTLFYAGQVMQLLGTDVVVNCLRKKSRSFIFPQVKDVPRVEMSKIKKILPTPSCHRGHFSFKICFPTEMNIR